MTVGELRVRMSSAEFSEWVALAAIEADERNHQQQRQQGLARRR